MQRGIIMKNNNLLEKIQADRDFEKNAAAEVRAEIDREMKKPARKRNYDRIAALSAEYNELIGAQEDAPHQEQEAIEKILSLTTQCQETTQKSKANIRLHRRIVAAAASVIVLLGASSVYHLSSVQHEFSEVTESVVEVTESVVTDNEDIQKIDIPTSAGDPYGIITECSKYGIYPETPYYLPEGFTLTNLVSNTDDLSSSVIFEFTKGSQIISLTYTFHRELLGQMVITNSQYTINGVPAAITKKDNQFTLAYEKNNTNLRLFAENVDYSECDKITESIK